MSPRPLVAPSVAAAAPRVTRVTGRALAATVLGALLLAAARPADAQITARRPLPPDPQFWVSVSPGLLQSQSVNDGESGSVWEFGSALQWRGSLEYGIGGGNAIGVVGTYANMPFTFFDPSGCYDGCDANVDVVGIAATFHGGGGQGLHQVIDASAGVVQYRSFDIRGGSVDPAIADRTDTDGAFSIGYGFGYEVSPRFQLSIVQDVGVLLHQKKNLPANASGVVRTQATRLNVRLGLGQRPAVR